MASARFSSDVTAGTSDRDDSTEDAREAKRASSGVDDSSFASVGARERACRLGGAMARLRRALGAAFASAGVTLVGEVGDGKAKLRISKLGYWPWTAGGCSPTAAAAGVLPMLSTCPAR